MQNLYLDASVISLSSFKWDITLTILFMSILEDVLAAISNSQVKISSMFIVHAFWLFHVVGHGQDIYLDAIIFLL